MGRSKGSWKSGKARGGGVERCKVGKTFGEICEFFPSLSSTRCENTENGICHNFIAFVLPHHSPGTGEGGATSLSWKCWKRGDGRVSSGLKDWQNVARKSVYELPSLWWSVIWGGVREKWREGREKAEAGEWEQRGGVCVCFRLVMHLPGIKRHEKSNHTQNWLYSVISST